MKSIECDCKSKDELMDYMFSKTGKFWVRPYVDVGGELNESRPIQDIFCSKRLGWRIRGMNYGIAEAIEMRGSDKYEEVICRLEGVWDEVEKSEV